MGLATSCPSALRTNWSLRYGKPLITPRRAPHSYVSCIFTSSLAAGLPWLATLGSQIISMLAWGQVAMISDYPRMQVMCALHKAVRGVFTASPWGGKEYYARCVRCGTPPAVHTC